MSKKTTHELPGIFKPFPWFFVPPDVQKIAIFRCYSGSVILFNVKRLTDSEPDTTRRKPKIFIKVVIIAIIENVKRFRFD